MSVDKKAMCIALLFTIFLAAGIVWIFNKFPELSLIILSLGFAFSPLIIIKYLNK